MEEKLALKDEEALQPLRFYFCWLLHPRLVFLINISDIHTKERDFSPFFISSSELSATPSARDRLLKKWGTARLMNFSLEQRLDEMEICTGQESKDTLLLFSWTRDPRIYFSSETKNYDLIKLAGEVVIRR